MSLDDPAGPLERLGACLSLDLGTCRGGESLRTIDLPPNLTVPLATLLGCQDELLEVAAAYGDALVRGALGLGGADDLSLGAHLSASELQQFIARLREGIEDGDDQDRLPVDLVLEIDKRKLLLHALGSPPPGARCELVFYPETLERLLAVPTRALDDWWHGVEEGKLAIFVPRWEGFLDGPYMAVVGGSPRAGFARLFGGPPRPEARRAG